jgi:type 1 glutamine amidotransferase
MRRATVVIASILVTGALLATTACQLLQPIMAPLPPVLDEGPFAWPAPPPAGDTRDVVIVFTKTHGFRHDVIPVTAAVVEGAARDVGLVPVVTDDAAFADDAVLARVAVVVFAHANGTLFTDAQTLALRRFVEGGGGLLLLHGAVGDWLPANAFMAEAVGARFVGHSLLPGLEEAAIVARRPHPITARLPPRVVVTDELYAFDRMPRGALVLASFASGTRVGGALDLTMDGEHPVLWTKMMGDGDVVVFTPGHVEATWRAPWMAPLLQDTLRVLAR